MDDLSKMMERQLSLEGHRFVHQKTILDFPEACLFLNIAGSQLVRLMYTGTIPCYMPYAHKYYFLRSELEKWLLHKMYMPYRDIKVRRPRCSFTSADTL